MFRKGRLVTPAPHNQDSMGLALVTGLVSPRTTPSSEKPPQCRLPKTNIDPDNGPLEECFPLPTSGFEGPC